MKGVLVVADHADDEAGAQAIPLRERSLKPLSCMSAFMDDGPRSRAFADQDDCAYHKPATEHTQGNPGVCEDLNCCFADTLLDSRFLIYATQRLRTNMPRLTQDFFETGHHGDLCFVSRNLRWGSASPAARC